MSAIDWRDRFGERATCVRCLEEKDTTDLDRLFWCQECRDRGRERAKRRGWTIGAGAAGVLALWIWLVIRPSTLILGGWIATVVAAFWLISRIAREIHYGMARYHNQRAVEATPPAEPREGEEEPEPDSDAAGPPWSESEEESPW